MEIAVWNSNIASDFNPGINNGLPSVGVAPLQLDLARHVYLEKRRVHAEMDRRSATWAGWRNWSQWVHDTTRKNCQQTLQWFNVRVARSIPETSRP